MLSSDNSPNRTVTNQVINVPSTIQPNGAVVAIAAGSYQILQVSANITDFFGKSPAELIGQPLSVLWPDRICCLLRDRLATEPEADQWAWDFKLPARRPAGAGKAPERDQFYSAAIHRQTTVLVLEVEPKAMPKEHQFLWHLRAVNDAVAKIRNATNLDEFAQLIAREIRKLTQFDRVMVYQFEPDGSGAVIAEDKQPHRHSHLHLHFPAADIPRAARALLNDSRTRAIADTAATAVPFVPAQHSAAGCALDMRAVGLRSAASCHLQYLTNMGVRASFVIPLVAEQQLWGLIACHHYRPRYLDGETRKACEFIGQFVCVELGRQQEQLATLQHARVKTIQAQFQQAVTEEPQFIAAILQRDQTELLNLVGAEGAAIVLDDQIWQLGRTPARAQTRALVDWLVTHHRQDVFATDRLSRDYPPARAFVPVASGLLAISIYLDRTSYHLLWFRPEVARTVDWAGNPYEVNASPEQDGWQCLSPRHSFALWQEVTQAQSRLWSPMTLEVARELRNTLLLAVLEFSQAALAEAAERANLANHAKSQFLAKMSHELRTPLNAILGFAQMMSSDRSLASEHQQNAQIIARSGEHLLTLINDVLEMSRIEAGRQAVHTEDFDLERAIANLHEMFARRAREQDLRWTIERSPDLPQYARGDERKLCQIWMNLIDNALKFTERGSVTLHLRASGNPLATAPETPWTLHFEVVDTGSGIPSEQLECIFDAFMQAGPEPLNSQGTGLGLAISRQFARLLGGDLTIRSQPERGTTFAGWVELQVAADRQPVTSDRSPIRRQLAGDQPSYRLLVAEDRAESQALMVQLLTQVGFQVKVAADGREAVRLWDVWQPHLIWMDLRMPVMDGCTATRAIRERELRAAQHSDAPASAQTVIIALTANAFESDRQQALDAGCDDFLAKPFQAAELLQKIAEYLGVRYVEPAPQRSERVTPATPQPNLHAKDLQVLPAAWRDRARQAALAVDDRTLQQLVAEIPAAQAALRQALQPLLDDFHLDILLELLESEALDDA